MLSCTLHIYYTAFRTSTSANPYSLVYGLEEVMPLKGKTSSLKIPIVVELEESKWAKLKFECVSNNYIY
jgi:hypothetical protein